jgi:phosphatidylinositol-3-phosphatase
MIEKKAIVIAAIGYIFFADHFAGAEPSIKHVFVIAMENTDAIQIYGKSKRAPYINSAIIPKYARATNFIDPLPAEDSEPHYLWMEAGTNAFTDHTFQSDDDPPAHNSTASTDHLVTQIKNSGSVTWITYQEDINSKTGLCPVSSSFPYAAKHNPFVFFQDVSGNPPSKTNTYCIDHTKPYSSFAADLESNNMANYVFITPNLCNDMHGAKKCPKIDRVTAGDAWLANELPRMIDWVHKNSGVIFIVWDEGSSTVTIPFLAIGPGVKTNYASKVKYDHGSLVRSIEEIFNLPILPTVSSKNNLADMFKAGHFP